jgi:NADH-quinone oxidoreductase subunit C
MTGQEFVDKLKSKFGDRIAGANLDNIDPWIEVTPDVLVEVCQYLHDQPDLAFDYLNCVSGVDYLHTDEKKAAKAGWEPHLEVVYHLFSMKHKHSLVLKVMLPRWKDDKPGELPEVPSVSGIWRTADWHEREVYDLVGVRFTGHPNLRRILCPDDWVGHPLRKDYEMPLEYHGIRGR